MKIQTTSLCLFLCAILVLSLLSGCEKAPEGAAINNISLGEYAIVYSDEDTDYAKRAAEYLQSQIQQITVTVEEAVAHIQAGLAAGNGPIILEK